MSDIALTEDVAIDRLAVKWAAQGYKLVKNPTGSELPKFLGSYRPDAILLGPSKVLVEVLRKGETDAPAKLKALRSLLLDHPDWRLEVVYAGSEPSTIPPVSTSYLRKRLGDLGHLRVEQTQAAFLLLWAVLEAIARRLEPTRTERPQSPGRVVEVLASEGHVLPDEADYLRTASLLRNRLIHGGLDVDVPVESVKRMEQIAYALLDKLAELEGSPVT